MSFQALLPEDFKAALKYLKVKKKRNRRVVHLGIILDGHNA
jgi:hypothetical protein